MSEYHKESSRLNGLFTTLANEHKSGLELSQKTEIGFEVIWKKKPKDNYTHGNIPFMIRQSLKKKKAKVFYVYCRIGGYNGVDEVSRIAKAPHSNHTLFFEMESKNFGYLEQQRKMIKWGVEHNVNLFKLTCHVSTEYSYEEHREDFDKLANMLEQESGDMRIALGLYLYGEKKDDGELEKLFVDIGVILQKKGISVIHTHMIMDTISEDLSKDWNTLEQEQQKANKAYLSRIDLRQNSGEYSVDVAMKYLSSFTYYRGPLSLPKGKMFNKFNYSKLQNIHFVIAPQNSIQQTIIIDGEVKIWVHRLRKFKDALENLYNHDNILNIHVDIADHKGVQREFESKAEEDFMYNNLAYAAAKFKKIEKVTLNNRKKYNLLKQLRKRDIGAVEEEEVPEPETPVLGLADLVKSDAQPKYNRTNIMVIGDKNAGKTAFIRSLVGKPMKKKSDKADTDTVMDVSIANWKKLGSFNISETLARDFVYLSGSTVKQQTNEETHLEARPLEFDENPIELLDRILPSIKSSYSSANDKEVDEKVLIENLTSLEDEMKLNFWEMSGSKVSKVLNPLFTRPDGIYLLVFDAEKLVSSDEAKSNIAIDKLRSWIKSVSFYTKGLSKVMLIGTRADAPVFQKEGFQNINEKLDKLIDEFDSKTLMILGNEDIDDPLWFFPVENETEGKKSADFLEPLKAKLSSAINTDTKVQLSWIFFMNKLMKEGKRIISFEEFEKRGQAIGFESSEIRSMLYLFSVSGSILDFSEIQADHGLSIVLQPLWLRDILTLFIQCNTKDSESAKKLKKIKMKVREAKNLVSILDSTKIMSSTVLEHVLNDEKTKLSEEEFNFIVHICEEYLIMSKLVKFPKSMKLSKDEKKENKFWLVSSFFGEKQGLLPIAKKEEKQKKNADSDDSDSEDDSDESGHEGKKEEKEEESKDFFKYIEFSKLVPSSLFEKFICTFIKHAKKGEKFKVLNITGSLLEAELSKEKFEIGYSEPSKYFVNVHSTDSSKIENVTNFVKAAYEELSKGRFAANIVDDSCEFFAGGDSDDDSESEEED